MPASRYKKGLAICKSFLLLDISANIKPTFVTANPYLIVYFPVQIIAFLSK